MIKRISVQNFKSLADFSIDLVKFNCLIGMNGSGKTTILQLVDFIAQLMEGRVQEWLTLREWNVQELASKLRTESNIKIRVDFEGDNKISWFATFNRQTLSCSHESFHVNGIEKVRVQSRKYRIGGQLDKDISFKYQGSILSQLLDSRLPPEVLAFKNALRNIRSLELLAPNLMRKRARTTDHDIGSGGEKLSAFLYGIHGEARTNLITLMQGFYPNLIDFEISSQRSGWKKLTFIERFGEQEFATEARHINDGLLRVLAIMAQANSDRSLILLDEVENGINPEITEKLVDALVRAPLQILVTTHSPMILNYLEDDVAKSSVQFIYKSPVGETKSRLFFSIQMTERKLAVMGAGEAFADTNLLELTDECVALDLAEVQLNQSRVIE